MVLLWSGLMVAALGKVLWHDAKKRPPVAETFMFIAWTRKDSGERPESWVAVAGGDEPDKMADEVEAYYPLATHDRIVLPTGTTPDGR